MSSFTATKRPDVEESVFRGLLKFEALSGAGSSWRG